MGRLQIVGTGLLGLVAAGGCTSATDKAEQRYAIVLKSGDADALCDEGRKLVAAYLEAGDATLYSEKKTAADIQCMSRRQDEAMGTYRMPDGSSKHIEADRLE